MAKFIHLRTDCRCGNSIYWREKEGRKGREGREPPQCEKCGKSRNWVLYPKLMAVRLGARVSIYVPIYSTENSTLREWWYKLWERYGRYPLYAMMLALPSDRAAKKYLTEYGKELHLITGRSCLVIALSKLGLTQYGEDDKIMPLALEEYIAEGYCLRVAELFNITLDEFPCLLLFRDIRKPEHILVTLKGLSVNEISRETRKLFSVIGEAVKQKKDPLTSLEEHNKRTKLSERHKSMLSNIRKLGRKTLESLMEAIIKAVIK